MKKSRLHILFLCLLVGSNLCSIQAKGLVASNEVFLNNVMVSIEKNSIEKIKNIKDTLFTLQGYYLKTKNTCKASFVEALIGRIYFDAGSSDSAIAHFIKASELNRANCSHKHQYFLYNSWAFLKQQMAEYAKSDSLFAIALQQARLSENPAYALNVQINQANLNTIQNNYPVAIRQMKNVLQVALQKNLKHHQYLSLQNLGAYYLDENKYDSAQYFLELLYASTDSNTPPQLRTDLYNNLAVVYENQKDYKRADQFYRQAIALARKNNLLGNLALYLKNYSDLKLTTKEYLISRKYLLQHLELKDQIFGEEKFEILKDLETQYETGKQKAKILELEKKTLQQNLELERKRKNRNTLIFLILSLLSVLIIVYTRMQSIRKNKKRIEDAKKRSEILLLNILPKNIATELKSKGESPARKLENVAVLFTDFYHFSQIAENLDAIELVKELNVFFTEFDRIVTALQIEKIKTIGDSYMAASGIPVSKPNAESALIEAALQMQAFVAKKNEENLRCQKPQFKMRVGIHFGTVIAGIVGDKKFQYDIWGDTVNTASRLETACEPGKVNISVSMYNQIKHKNHYTFEKRGLINTKGKGKMEMYYVSKKCIA